MQANVIVLPVDLLNNSSTTDLTLSRVEEHLNRSVYIGGDHEPGVRDTLTLYRTPPKPTSNFKGVMKSAAKFTADKTVADPVGGNVDAALIGEASFSIPIGVTAADMMILRQRMIALLDDDSIMDDLMRLQMV
jgi:hypothetical protein